jgi:DNA repair protein RecO (recombination protein O)
MPQERLYRTEGIVLREMDYGEADRILTILTPERKLSVIAKGIRRATSRKAGHLGLFAHANLLIARGRNLDIVTQAESIEEFEGLRQDLLRFTYACYAAELVDRLAQEEEGSAELYRLMLDGLRWFSAVDDLRLWMRFFELRLLRYAGYEPELFICTQCQQPIEARPNAFSAAEGGMVCAHCGHMAGAPTSGARVSSPAGREEAGQRPAPQDEGEGAEGARVSSPALGATKATPASLNAQKVLRFLQTRSPDEIARLRITEETHAEVEKLLQDYLEYVLERELRSAAFLRRVRHELHAVEAALYRNASQVPGSF